MIGAVGDLRVWELDSLVRTPPRLGPLPRARVAPHCMCSLCLPPPDRGRSVSAQVKGLEGRADEAVLSQASAALSLLQALESAAGEGVQPRAKSARGAFPPEGNGAVPDEPVDGAEDSIRLVQSAEGRNAKLREFLTGQGRLKGGTSTDDELVSQSSEKNNAMREFLMQCKINRHREREAPNTRNAREASGPLPERVNQFQDAMDLGIRTVHTSRAAVEGEEKLNREIAPDERALRADEQVALPTQPRPRSQRAAAPRATRSAAVGPITISTTRDDAFPLISMCTSQMLNTSTGVVELEAKPHVVEEVLTVETEASVRLAAPKPEEDRVEEDSRDLELSLERKIARMLQTSSRITEVLSSQQFTKSDDPTRQGPHISIDYSGTSMMDNVVPGQPKKDMHHATRAAAPGPMRNSPAPSPVLTPAPMLLTRANNHSHGQSDARRETPRLVASQSPSQRPHVFRSIGAPRQNRILQERASPAPALLHAKRESSSSNGLNTSQPPINLDAPKSLDLTESAGELAPGWEQKHDTKTNRFFYVNHELRAISWLRPTMAVAGCNGPWATAQEAGEVKSIEPVSRFSDYQVVGNGSKSRMSISQEVLFSHVASDQQTAGRRVYDDGDLDCDAESVLLTGFLLASESEARDTDLDREWDELALEKELERELRQKLEEAMGHDHARIKQQKKDFVDNLKYMDLEQALDEGGAFIC